MELIPRPFKIKKISSSGADSIVSDSYEYESEYSKEDHEEEEKAIDILTSLLSKYFLHRKRDILT